MSADIKVGDIYEDCFNHPVLCTEVDDEGVQGKSLIDGSEPRSCSLGYCRIRKMTQEQADEAIAVFNKDGERGLLRLRGWGEEEINEFMKNWR